MLKKKQKSHRDLGSTRRPTPDMSCRIESKKLGSKQVITLYQNQKSKKRVEHSIMQRPPKWLSVLLTWIEINGSVKIRKLKKKININLMKLICSTFNKIVWGSILVKVDPEIIWWTNSQKLLIQLARRNSISKKN